MKLLNERDGLVLGICNGFQALIKLGLVPYGEIVGQTAGFSDTDLQYHRTAIFPRWFTRKLLPTSHHGCRGQSLAEFIPIRHPTERDVLLQAKEWLDKLFANGQVATQYCDLDGNAIYGRRMERQWLLSAQLKVSQVRMAVCLVRWHIQNVVTDSVAINIYGEQDMKIFESGVKYFK